jgi:protein-S-isoprenylcysteine O-methyltransferase Ste14
MTAGHLLFAGVLTAYMALAAIVEERDLVSFYGRQYEAYRQRVPMFVPSLKANAKTEPADSPAKPQSAVS